MHPLNFQRRPHPKLLNGPENTVKCSKCGATMELKGELGDSRPVIQCPNCKNVELLEGYSDNWFSLGYP